MKTKTKNILIHSMPDKVFVQMDDFSKTGMHMTESSMMMMGSKLNLEQLSTNPTGVGAKYRWYGKMMGMTMDFSETVTKWQPPILKEWETFGDSKMIIMSWYRMWLEITPAESGANAKISISYLPPKEWYYKILSFLFADWYCNWCLNNMLTDTKRKLELNLTGKHRKNLFKPSVAALVLAGVLCMVMGVYFIFLRPPLLPEDSAYMGTTLPSINGAVPGLSAWLEKVFWVLGGYIFATGLMIVYVANTSFKNRLKGAFSIVTITGLSSIGIMTCINFSINSNFKWMLLAFTLPWLIGLILYRMHK